MKVDLFFHHGPPSYHVHNSPPFVSRTVFQILLASSCEALPYTSPTGRTFAKAALCCAKHSFRLAASAARMCPGSGMRSSDRFLRVALRDVSGVACVF